MQTPGFNNMPKIQLTPAKILLITINLIPLYGVWFRGWDAAQVFLVYALETIIIGVMNVIKLAIVTIFVKPKDEWQNGVSKTSRSGWFFILFFIMHYGIFVFVQTQIFFGVSGIIKGGSTFGKYAHIPGALGDDGILLLFIFIGYHLLQLYLGFISTGEYKRISMATLMFQPYVRILVQQFIVILGSMFLSFGLGKVFILILVAVIIFFEVLVDYERLLAVGEKKQDEEINN